VQRPSASEEKDFQPMRQPHQIAVDRALLLYALHLAEPHGLLSDVKLQQLCFLCELQMFGKASKGFILNFSGSPTARSARIWTMI
jgi:hypothetical protein